MTPDPVSPPVPTARIPARSQRQAMDWSLVLISQGIEVLIDYSPDVRSWELQVEPQDLERAMAAIRQYRLENRGWAWRQRLSVPGLFFHWGTLLWCWLLITLHWVVDAAGAGVEGLGVMSNDALGRGEWWRAVTAVGLHADVGHLAANASTGLIVFGLAMARFGAGWTMLAGLLAGAAGNVAGYLFHARPYIGLGASGMVMGGLGLLAVQSAFLLRESPKSTRQVIVGLLAGFLLFVLVGLNPASDVLAHTGGFVAGLVLGLGLAFLPEDWARGRRPDQWAGGVAVVLFGLCWALAFVFGQPVAPGNPPPLPLP